MSTDEAKRLGELTKLYLSPTHRPLVDRLVAMVQGVGKMREAISEAKDLMLRGETHAALGKLHAAEDAAPQQPQPAEQAPDVSAAGDFTANGAMTWTVAAEIGRTAP